MSMKHGSKRASARKLRGHAQKPQAVPQAPIRDPRVKIVIDLMRTNLHRRIRLAELAESTNLSTFYLSSLFKTETGLPPGEYLRRLRTEKARCLLATSLLSVKQIMALTGYNNRNNFAGHFKRPFGVAPSEYRRKERLLLIAKSGRPARNRKIV
jgi:transcriptional regulator GlxA family with amidase domain